MEGNDRSNKLISLWRTPTLFRPEARAQTLLATITVFLVLEAINNVKFAP